MSIARTFLILGSLLLIPAPALAWGKTGHRAAAAIADKHLSGLARAHVREILGTESLDEAGTWPDEMKSDPSEFWKKTASPWHYVTVGGFVYDAAPPEGDAIEALERFSLDWEGPPHDALADAKNLARLFMAVAQRLR